MSFHRPSWPHVCMSLSQNSDFYFNLPDNTSFGYDMGWWKEEHFNASDADGDGLLNITEFNE